MNGKDFNEVVNLILKQDGRYEKGAYHLLRQGLDFTLKRIQQESPAKRPRHVSGGELCKGLRDYILEQYGPMGATLLREWGIKGTEDFGRIVFNLVDYEVFAKTETDSIQDFENVFDFHEAFVRPFLPAGGKAHQHRRGGDNGNAVNGLKSSNTDTE